ncbi:Translational activator GCN1 [Hordeum vulgare]|nr:Translational activator GCN1 [Hordeum vulgare]
MEEEINVFCSMTEAVKEVATVIRECKPLDVHPDLYGAVMTQGGFSDEALMASLSHLLDNKVQGVSAQVASYSNSSHRGFKTRHATEQAYSDWVQKHGGNSVDSGKVGGVKVEDGTADRRLGLKRKNFIIFAQFIAIVVL